MPTEVRVLGATALFTAALVWLAWWLGQHRVEVARQVHDVETVSLVELPALSRSEPPRALPAMPPDAGFASPFDAGVAMEGTEAELAAILIPAICNRRRNECGCTEYPSRFAPEEERIGATTCEQDTLRDFRIWWRNNIRGPVVVVGEPELSEALAGFIDCEGLEQPEVFVCTEAAAGDGDSFIRACETPEPCEECALFQQLGERCRMEQEREPDPANDCAPGLMCSDGRCQVRVFRECPIESLTRSVGAYMAFGGPVECLPVGTECWDHGDCGSGVCVGLGPSEFRCVADPQGTGWDPGDHDTIPCHSARCERGTACLPGRWECLPVVGLSERCEETFCGTNLRCERVHRARGHCIHRACLTSHPFGSLRMEGIQ